MSKKFIPFKFRARKIKRYADPIFYSLGGNCYVEKKYKSVIKDGLPFKDNKVIKFVGYTPNYVGYAPSFQYTPNYRLQKFLAHHSHILKDHEKSAIDTQRSVWSGGYDTYKRVLDKFAEESHEKLTCKEYLKILEEEDFPWLRLPRLNFPKEEDISKVYINEDAHPGFFTKLFFGDKRKDTVNKSVEIAKSIYRHLKTKRFAWQGLWTLGGRSKDVKVTNEYNADISTRPIWIPEEPLVLLSLIIVQPITAALKYSDTNCVFIGKNFSIKENRWISRIKQSFDWQFRCDWKNFDSDVTEEVLLAAFCLLRKIYPENDRSIDRYFSFLYDTVRNKNLVIPPGFVFKFSKGMPSGHPLVSLINTFVNYIVWVTILQKIFGKGKVAASCYGLFGGDDSLIFSQWNDKLLHINRIIKNSTHFHSDDVLNSLSPTGVNSSDTPDCRFFKRFVSNSGMVNWHFSSLLRKFLYNDSKKFDDYHFQIKWLSNALSTCPFDERLIRFIEIYVPWLIKYCSKGKHIDHKYIYTKIKLYEEFLTDAMLSGIKNAVFPLILVEDTNYLKPENFFKSTSRKHISLFLDGKSAFCNKIDLLTATYIFGSSNQHIEAFSGLRKDSMKALNSGKIDIKKQVLESSFLNRTQAIEVIRILSLLKNTPTILKRLVKLEHSSYNIGLLDLINKLRVRGNLFKNVFPSIFKDMRKEIRAYRPRDGIFGS